MISKIRLIEEGSIAPRHGELKAASSRRSPRRAAPASVQTLVRLWPRLGSTYLADLCANHHREG
jgi:hypothetical protein